MGVRRDKIDEVVSKLVRERDSWTCQRCHTYFPEGPPRRGLHNAHLWTRRSRSIRYHPDACVSLCYGCHQYLDSHPAEKEAWARRHLGDVVYDELLRRAKRVRKWTPADKAEMYRHLKSELKRLEALRAEGRTGYLSVVAYE